MATIKGKGIVWSVNGITMTAGIVTATGSTGALQSMRLIRSADNAEVKNSDGETVVKVFFNHKKTVTIGVVPTGTTVALAQAAGDGWVPASGLLVTMVDADGTIADDNYNVLQSSQNRTNDGVMSGEVELEAFDANEVATVPIT